MTKTPLFTLCLLATAMFLGVTTVQAQSELVAQVSGPEADVKVTETYVRMMAREAYFWGWPMANIYNRRLKFKDLPQAGLMGGLSLIHI